MEKELEDKFDAIMGKPGVIGIVCADQRGLCLSARGVGSPDQAGAIRNIADQARKLEPNSTTMPIIRLESDQGYCLVQKRNNFTLDGRRTVTPEVVLTDDMDSSDEDDIVFDTPRKRPAKIQPSPDSALLSGSVKSASFNIIFQVLIRVFTFGLNAFILRYVTHDVLGICNVRLFLLYSSIMFLSREPFRRASHRVSHDSKESWTAAVNLIWFAVPNTAFWSLLLGPVWYYVLSQPTDPNLASQYRLSVILICVATFLDSIAEVPYIVAKYFLYYKLRIVGETLLIVIRSTFLCIAVIFFPEVSVLGYAIGSVTGAATVCLMYYAFFHYVLTTRKDERLTFTSVKDLLPSGKWEISRDMTSFTWSFYKQSILKQVLTEGERYLMTFFDILTFEEQGVYDLVSNLGSLAARFVFQPIEENAYQYFGQTLQRRCSFKRREKAMAENAAYVLSNVVRLMFLIGLTIVVFGLPYSSTLLYLYGGKDLSDTGPGTVLLQANCLYIFVMAINGVTEAFTQAAMTQEEMNGFNRRLLLFSGLFILSSFVSTKIFGSLGFYIANSLNMGLRVGQSVQTIRHVFMAAGVNPFTNWWPKIPVGVSFVLSFLWILVIMAILESRFVPVLIGLVTLVMNLFVIFKYDQELIIFFVRLYKTKTV